MLASGLLFFIRGLAVQLGAAWPMVAPLRYASYAIDSLLLAAAITLSTLLHSYPLTDNWLTLKVVLLVLYIVAGSFALKRGHSRAMKLTCWLIALLLYAAIITVARTRFPLQA